MRYHVYPDNHYSARKNAQPLTWLEASAKLDMEEMYPLHACTSADGDNLALAEEPKRAFSVPLNADALTVRGWST
jgi:hypothetical protein